MKKVYRYYENPQGAVALRTQLRVHDKQMPLIRKLDAKCRKLQTGYKYSRNEAVLEAIRQFVS